MRLAARAFVRRPAYTLLLVATLALGIGANATIFSFVNAVLLTPLPFPEPDRLVTLSEIRLDMGNTAGVAPATLVDWQTQNRSFTDLASFERSGFVLQGAQFPERVSTLAASPTIFRLLGNGWRFGTGFPPELTPDEAAAQQMVVTSATFARRWWGDDTDPTGLTLLLNDAPYSVVGVLPDGFRFVEQADLWVPRTFSSDEMSEGMRGARYMHAIARLAPNVTLEMASRDMDGVAQRLGEQHPNSRGWGARVANLHDSLTADVRRPLYVMLVGVAFVLLIACGNAANLVLGRAAQARREWVVRTALGASGGRLLRTSIVEHIFISACAGLAGLLLTVWALPSIVALAPADMPQIHIVAADGSVVAFIALASAAIGLVLGLVPWIGRARKAVELNQRTPTSLSRAHVRHALIGTEVAISVVLLVGSGLLAKSLWRLRDVDPGFEAAGLHVMSVSLPQERYQTAAQRVGFARAVRARLQSVDAVSAAALTNNLPFSGSRFRFGFTPEGYQPEPGATQPSAEYHAVSPAYFHTMNVGVVTGRPFREDDSNSARPVVIINELIARRYYADMSPVGKSLTVVSQAGPLSREIVGVVAAVKHGGPSSESIPEVYVPFAQDSWLFMTFVFRGTPGTDPTSTARSIVADLDPALPAADVQPMQIVAAQWYAPLRFQMLLAGAFSTFAIALACVGLYGVISYLVGLQTNEIGVRLALGARQSRVFGSVIGTGVLVSAAGIVAGLLASAAMSRTLSGLLFDVTPLDPGIYFGTSTLVLAVAFLASAIPAHRATRIDPALALRAD
jgi:predicted permease